MRPKVKICCISNIAEAKIGIEFGATALGLVANMPSGPGIITDEKIFEIAKTIPSTIASFLLTSETAADKIIQHHKRTITNTIQIVDKLKEGTYKQIKEALPTIKIVQVIHVLDEKSIDEALRLSAFVDALLLDSGNPNLAIKELGGTGRVHNWKLSKKIVEQCKVPVYLAGGLHANNVLQAIEQIQPFGVDVCSGVRANNRLDLKKLEDFFNVLSK